MKYLPQVSFIAALSLFIVVTICVGCDTSATITNSRKNENAVEVDSKHETDKPLKPRVVDSLNHNLLKRDTTDAVVYGGAKDHDVIMVSTALPERLYLYVNNSVVFSTYANTGISQSPTPYGIFSIYMKLKKDTMHGVNQNGKPYYDPNVPWVMYFHGNDAIHGFYRKQYGFPQSLGCVELPVAAAKRLYHMVPLRTRVIITSKAVRPLIDDHIRST